MLLKFIYARDFSGDPVVKPSYFNAKVQVQSLVWVGAKIPHASWPKTQNINSRNNIVANSIKTENGPH